MDIPKVIHYCWFGGKPLPKTAKKCIKSWKKYCPDYIIKEWNESNFDLNCNVYCKEMARKGKWAFLTDYVRLKVIYENGGIYLDTDVRVIRPLNELVEQGSYMGVENTRLVNTGLGFAAMAGHPFIKENLDYYEEIENIEQPCSCPIITTKLLEKYGYNKLDNNIQYIAGLTIYPQEFLCPKNERTGITKITENTYSVHQFEASWFEDSWKKGQKKRWRDEKIRYILHTPNRAGICILGSARYEKIKNKLNKIRRKSGNIREDL